MKTLNSSKWRYVGTSDGWHVFESRISDFDPEILYLSRCRMIMEDGSSKFFDPLIPPANLVVQCGSPIDNRRRRLESYAKAISSSMSVKPMHRVGRIPKRKDAGGNSPVSNSG